MTKHCCLQAEITLMRFHLGSHWWHLLASPLLPLTGFFFFFPNQQRTERRSEAEFQLLLPDFTVVHSAICDLCDI